MRFATLICLMLCVANCKQNGSDIVNSEQGNQIPITQSVDAGISYGKSLQCTAYLYIPEDQAFNPNNNFPLYFIQMGTGLETEGSPNEKIGFDQQMLKSDGHEYLLMMDKPGLSYDPTAPDDVKIDRNYYDYYTTDNLIECANNALIWAYGQKLLTSSPP